MDKTTIRFMAGVDDVSVGKLINLVDGEIQIGIKSFRIIISSPGGYVNPGISAFNYLKGIPAEIETVNFGVVDSISVVIFCAGKKRISVPNARFIVHDISNTIQQAPTNLTETQLVENLNSLKKDRKNIARIISETCGVTTIKIENLLKKGQVLDAQEAKKLGLVQEIDPIVVEPEAKILSVN